MNAADASRLRESERDFHTSSMEKQHRNVLLVVSAPPTPTTIRTPTLPAVSNQATIVTTTAHLQKLHTASTAYRQPEDPV